MNRSTGPQKRDPATGTPWSPGKRARGIIIPPPLPLASRLPACSPSPGRKAEGRGDRQ